MSFSDFDYRKASRDTSFLNLLSNLPLKLVKKANLATNGKQRGTLAFYLPLCNAKAMGNQKYEGLTMHLPTEANNKLISPVWCALDKFETR